MRAAIYVVVASSLVGCGSHGSDAMADATAADATGDVAVGSGTCLGPAVVSLGFQTDASASTASQLDTTMVICAPVANVPEVVYQLVLSQATTVHITASDRSGQGIGFQVRSNDCMGTSVRCSWSNAGNIDETLALPLGTWVFIVERNPAGAFAFGIAL